MEMLGILIIMMLPMMVGGVTLWYSVKCSEQDRQDNV